MYVVVKKPSDGIRECYVAETVGGGWEFAAYQAASLFRSRAEAQVFAERCDGRVDEEEPDEVNYDD